MTPVSENINQIISLTEAEKGLIDEAFKPIQISKGNFWIMEGRVCDQIAFVQTGKLRIFYRDDSGNEITCYFVTADNFFTSFTSYLTNTPTAENIAAMEDSQLMVIAKAEMEKLSDQILKLQVWRRVIAENLFIIMEKRISMLQSQSAHERYERMLKENSEIILSVPLQYTASFLGITPQHLSRLRRDLQK